MHFLQLTLLYWMLNFYSGEAALEYAPSSATKGLKCIAANTATTTHVEPGATDIILQSKDDGETWQDISHSLPENEQPEGFFAGEGDIYLRVNNKMYRSKSNLKTPVWEKEDVLDARCSSIAFNHSGVMAYNYEGDIYQKAPATENWLPVYTNFKNQAARNIFEPYTNFKPQSIRTIFEISNGAVFLGCDAGLYKSADGGRSWKQVLNEGWVMDVVEWEGVLVGTGQKGIMRSTDNGEHWEWVISEGGVGIAAERIDGGFAVISYNSSTKSRRIRISTDRGKTWKAIDEGLRPSLSISSIKQMGKYLICGHPDGIFRSSDMGKTWDIVHLRVDSAFKLHGNTWNSVPSIDGGKVFKIYASGDVLYAVARDSGC